MVQMRITAVTVAGLGLALALGTPAVAFGGGAAGGHGGGGHGVTTNGVATQGFAVQGAAGQHPGSGHRGGQSQANFGPGRRFDGGSIGGSRSVGGNGFDRDAGVRTRGVIHGGYGNGVAPNQNYARPAFYSAPGFANGGYNGGVRYTYGTVYNQPRLGHGPGYGRRYGRGRFGYGGLGLGYGYYDPDYEGAAYGYDGSGYGDVPADGPQGIDFGEQGYDAPVHDRPDHGYGARCSCR